MRGPVGVVISQVMTETKTTAPARLETPEAMAEASWPFNGWDEVARLIHADREQFAAKCCDLAAAAQREADAHDAQLDSLPLGSVDRQSKHERIGRCEGQAAAFRAVAALLGGGR